MLRIRPATEVELDEAGRLTRAAYELYREHIPDAFWEPYAAELEDARGRAGMGTVLVAEIDGELVGSASVVREPDAPDGTLTLRMLAVSEAMRGRGVGRALMDAVIAHARATGADTMVWNTVSFMTPARALYARLGYEPEPDPRELAPGILMYTYRTALSDETAGRPSTP